jgi:hypothetical protein
VVERIFNEAVKESESSLKIYDFVELLVKIALEGGNE